MAQTIHVTQQPVVLEGYQAIFKPSKFGLLQWLSRYYLIGLADSSSVIYWFYRRNKREFA